MYKLIASDMDETFLDSEHRIPAPNVEALKRLRELGVLFVPSSGRPYRSIMANFADVDPELMRDTYVISYNGGFINRFGDSKPLLSTLIDRESVEFLYRYGIEHRLAMHIYTDQDDIFTQFLPPEEDEYVRTIEGVVPLDDDVSDLSFAEGKQLVKILYMDTDFAHCKQLGSELAPLIDPTKVDITYSSARYVEFVPAGVNKGTGLAHLAELLDIDISQTIGFGDAANDIDMLKAAGLGVGVANVSDDARPYCGLVLNTTGGEGALPELVERVIEPEHRTA
ncbi:Cof-type HAD-IIB family hydrolase [Enorma phocaeensis]|uniref:Cof-type HAD-IIB family hydrolase n=1 Tax=Enorma phocaeensis TaxID=1871019 RepID=A0A921LVI9_9ACTN|nr:Cof-type HAD-IIB family hydrolase [Enorma phocaeensis]HJG37940.1 Cof-type HAD-IIB family hydrolase [Enorma phocaeensis]